MREMVLESWEEFLEKLSYLNDYRNNFKEISSITVSPWLFRGHAHSEWRLATTLDRYANIKFRLIDYFRIIIGAKPMIETFTDKTWSNVPLLKDIDEHFRDFDPIKLWDFPAYDYMVYLRHPGFPSPLLDWTASPYIAAFFAFNSIAPETERVAIYSYIESIGGGKSSSSDEPTIYTLGPYVKSHKRHFLQQSQYTLCYTFNEEGAFYANHEDVFSRNDEIQDLLWRFTIPATERLKVLKKLQEVNINSFSLFGTEESLMETVAQKEIRLKE